MSKRPKESLAIGPQKCWACGSEEAPLEQISYGGELMTVCVNPTQCRKRWEKSS